MDVKLDRDVMKALSSDTRVDILKELRERPHMQSELAKGLDLSVPTIKEHLAALEKAGLVERKDEGRKWKYYSLTKKGKSVLEPEGIRLFLVLGVWLFSVAATLHLFLKGPIAPPFAPEAMQMSMTEAAPHMMAKSAALAEPVASVYPMAFYYWLAAAIAVSLLLVFLIKRRYKYQQSLGKHLSKK